MTPHENYLAAKKNLDIQNERLADAKRTHTDYQRQIKRVKPYAYQEAERVAYCREKLERVQRCIKLADEARLAAWAAADAVEDKSLMVNEFI